MFGNTIGKRVAKVIKQRVEQAQKEHDDKVVALQKELEEKTEQHAQEMVEKIVGKV